MPLSLDLSTAKTCSIASFLIALLFTYGAITIPDYWLIPLAVSFVVIGLWLHNEEIKIRRYEADKLVEMSRLEKEKTVEAERLKTNREERKAQERAARDARRAAQKGMERAERNKGKLISWFLDRL